MPIRFRCTSLQKLLGIARRKAGDGDHVPALRVTMIVPTEVPATDPGPTAAGDRLPGGPRLSRSPRTAARDSRRTATNGNGLPPRSRRSRCRWFERPDFESLTEPGVTEGERPLFEHDLHALLGRSPVPAAGIAEASPRRDHAGTGPTTKRRTTWSRIVPESSRRRPCRVMAVVVVMLLGLAFAAGYLLAAARLPAG